MCSEKRKTRVSENNFLYYKKYQILLKLIKPLCLFTLVHTSYKQMFILFFWRDQKLYSNKIQTLKQVNFLKLSYSVFIKQMLIWKFEMFLIYFLYF